MEGEREERTAVRVLNDNKVLAYAFNPERLVREDSTVVKVLDDDKVLVHAVNPKRTERGESIVVKVINDNKVVIYTLNPKTKEREERDRKADSVQLPNVPAICTYVPIHGPTYTYNK